MWGRGKRKPSAKATSNNFEYQILERKEKEKLTEDAASENETNTENGTNAWNEEPVYPKEDWDQNEEETQREKQQEEKFDHLSEPVNAFHGKSRLILLCGCTSMGSALFGYNQAIFGTLFEPLGTHESIFW